MELGPGDVSLIERCPHYPAAAHVQSGVKQLVLSVSLSVFLSSKKY